MTDVLVPFGGEFIALSQNQLQEAVKRGRELLPPTPAAVAQPADTILDADGMAAVTGVPASWFGEQARQGKIPYLRVGKYVRFRLNEVLEALAVGVRPGDSLSIVRKKREPKQNIARACYQPATKKIAV